MKNIIPFKKDVIFKTNINEITSISLENTLSIKDDTISGDFIVSGEYKVSDKSTTVEPFELKLPFEIVIDDRYNTEKAIIDIDDFYYEIVNDNVLSVSIDVLIDKLQEKPLIELDDLVDLTPNRDIIDSKEEDDMQRNENEIIDSEINTLDKLEDSKKAYDDEIITLKDNKIEDDRDNNDMVEEKINSLFNQFNSDSEVYVAYNVFILREGDTLDSIMEKYNITEEELKKYNDLTDLKLGDKLIIPNTYERD